MDKHPHPTLLTRFGRGRLQRRKSRDVVRHLLTDCEDCRRVTSQLLPPAGTRADGAEAGSVQSSGETLAIYEPAFDRSHQEGRAGARPRWPPSGWRPPG